MLLTCEFLGTFNYYILTLKIISFTFESIIQLNHFPLHFCLPNFPMHLSWLSSKFMASSFINYCYMQYKHCIYIYIPPVAFSVCIMCLVYIFSGLAIWAWTISWCIRPSISIPRWDIYFIGGNIVPLFFKAAFQYSTKRWKGLKDWTWG